MYNLQASIHFLNCFSCPESQGRGAGVHANMRWASGWGSDVFPVCHIAKPHVDRHLHTYIAIWSLSGPNMRD